MPKELQDLGAQFHASLLMCPTPEIAQALLGGWLASVLGQLPDEFWQEMMKAALAPCDQPDCGCEKFREPVMRAFELLREYWKEQAASNH